MKETPKPFQLGIYEKALPKGISWQDRLSIAKGLGFDFVEMSIDEQDFRLERLGWTKEERIEFVQAVIKTGIFVPSICLSGHRRFPFGSKDEATRQRAYEIMEKAIHLARDIGVRTIQLAGYDVYYEESDEQTLALFEEGLQWAVKLASQYQITLAVETMDTKLMSSISRWKKYDEKINSPYFKVYPDIGNLSAWSCDIDHELAIGIDKITAFHLKDTYAVTETCKGQFRDVPFGDGCVDFVGFFEKLKKYNYRGSFMIEMWSENSDEPLKEIIKAKEFIFEQMKKAEFLC